MFLSAPGVVPSLPWTFTRLSSSILLHLLFLLSSSLSSPLQLSSSSGPPLPTLCYPAAATRRWGRRASGTGSFGAQAGALSVVSAEKTEAINKAHYPALCFFWVRNPNSTKQSLFTYGEPTGLENPVKFEDKIKADLKSFRQQIETALKALDFFGIEQPPSSIRLSSLDFSSSQHQHFRS